MEALIKFSFKGKDTISHFYIAMAIFNCYNWVFFEEFLVNLKTFSKTARIN
jgi:hypothetical protein